MARPNDGGDAARIRRARQEWGSPVSRPDREGNPKGCPLSLIIMLGGPITVIVAGVETVRAIVS
jgi:hypothetical protein